MESAEKTSPGSVGVNYGIYLGLILVVIQVIMYVTGWALEGVQWPVYIYYLIFPVFIFLAISAYKKGTGGFLSLSEALKTGVVTAVISGIIYLIYNILMAYVIDPGFTQQALDMARDNMTEGGQMTEEQIEMSMQFAEYGANPFLGSAIWIALSALFGLIYSLIIGAIMKQQRPYEE